MFLSISHTLRVLDRAAAGLKARGAAEGIARPLGPAQRAFDLDKSDAQVAEATTEPDLETAAVPCRTPSVTQESNQTPGPPPIPYLRFNLKNSPPSQGETPLTAIVNCTFGSIAPQLPGLRRCRCRGDRRSESAADFGGHRREGEVSENSGKSANFGSFAQLEAELARCGAVESPLD
jgi:hypothetical protein